MECNEIQNKWVDYIEDSLTANDSTAISKHLQNCGSCRNELTKMQKLLNTISNHVQEQPSKNLQLRFENALAKEKELSETKIFTLTQQFHYKLFLKYVAGVALLIGAFFFGKFQKTDQQATEISALKNESLHNKQATMLALMENESASKRIQGVQYIDEFSNPDPEIVEALVKRMLYDENTNVRLTAVNALEAFIASEIVKEGFIEALETEKDPAIQISIIKSLVKIQERKAIKPLQKLLEEEETQSFVKDEIKTVLTNII